MEIISFIISLISGAIGGNLAGAALKDQSLGAVGNSIAGILGGGIGGVLLQALGLYASGGGMDLGSLIGNIASGGVGGGLLMVIVGLLKSVMAEPSAHAAQQERARRTVKMRAGACPR